VHDTFSFFWRFVLMKDVVSAFVLLPNNKVGLYIRVSTKWNKTTFFIFSATHYKVFISHELKVFISHRRIARLRHYIKIC
jgi:hypothetical protein